MIVVAICTTSISTKAENAKEKTAKVKTENCLIAKTDVCCAPACHSDVSPPVSTKEIAMTTKDEHVLGGMTANKDATGWNVMDGIPIAVTSNVTTNTGANFSGDKKESEGGYVDTGQKDVATMTTAKKMNATAVAKVNLNSGKEMAMKRTSGFLNLM